MIYISLFIYQMCVLRHTQEYCIHSKAAGFLVEETWALPRRYM